MRRKKTYRFESPDRIAWRSVGRDVRASLERQCGLNGFDIVRVGGRDYSLQSDLERAAQAIERSAR